MRIVNGFRRPTDRALVVGLTGGIGAGKSTVASLLASKGAVVVDADAIVRDLQGAGGAAVAEIAREFGPEVVGADGAIHRPALARVAFEDAEAMGRLEAIIHPAVAREAWGVLGELEKDVVGVYDVPLLVEKRMGPQFDVVLVVEAEVDVRLARLEERGIARSEALRRMARQATDEERRAAAHIVVDNSAGLAGLRQQIDEVWDLLTRIDG